MNEYFKLKNKFIDSNLMKLSKHYICYFRKAFVRSIDFLQVDNLNQKILGLHKKEVFVIAIKNTAKAALTVRILDAFNIYNTDDVKFNYKPNSFGKGEILIELLGSKICCNLITIFKRDICR